MRCADHIIQRQEGIVVRGLFLEHIERGPCHLAALERFIKVRLVYDASAGAVDYPNAVLHLAYRLCVNDALCFSSHRSMNGYEISLNKEFVQRDLPDARGLC